MPELKPEAGATSQATRRRRGHRPRWPGYACRRLSTQNVTASFYVLTLAGNRIRANTRFEASVLPWFGLPRSLPAR
jgi:hypothetical protein